MTTFAFDIDHARRLAQDLYQDSLGSNPALPALPQDATLAEFSAAVTAAVDNVHRRINRLRADAASAATSSAHMVEDAARSDSALARAFAAGVA